MFSPVLKVFQGFGPVILGIPVIFQPLNGFLEAREEPQAHIPDIVFRISPFIHKIGPGAGCLLVCLHTILEVPLDVF